MALGLLSLLASDRHFCWAGCPDYPNQESTGSPTRTPQAAGLRRWWHLPCTQGHRASQDAGHREKYLQFPAVPQVLLPHATSFHPCGHFEDRCHDLYFADGETEVSDQAGVISGSLMGLALTASIHSHLMPSAGAVGTGERTVNTGAMGWCWGLLTDSGSAGKVCFLHGLGRPGCRKRKPSARNLTPFLGSFSNCHGF